MFLEEKVIKKKMKISLDVAVSMNGIIGKNNAIPWHLPEDLKRFKQLTTGKPVIMGRRTFESIRKPLPDRMNIVLTKDNGGKFMLKSTTDVTPVIGTNNDGTISKDRLFVLPVIGIT